MKILRDLDGIIQWGMFFNNGYHRVVFACAVLLALAGCAPADAATIPAEPQTKPTAPEVHAATNEYSLYSNITHLHPGTHQYPRANKHPRADGDPPGEALRGHRQPRFRPLGGSDGRADRAGRTGGLRRRRAVQD